MKQAYKYDQDGKYIEPVIIYPDENGNYVLPESCTFEELPQPNWKPFLQNGKWVETATEEEKNPPVAPPQPPVEEKLVQMEQDVADLWYSVMMGGLV